MLENLVSTHGMLISGAILLVAYIFIATEKIQKSVVALVGASLTLLLGLLPFTGILTRKPVFISGRFLIMYPLR